MENEQVIPVLEARSLFAAGYAKSTDHSKTRYDNPLVGRYTSKEMNFNWSPQKKFSTWRKLWIALAQAEQELGLKQISTKQIEQMKKFVDDINWDVAAANVSSKLVCLVVRILNSLIISTLGKRT